MPRPPHSKKSGDDPLLSARELAEKEAAALDLRRQVAVLADQVRQLGGGTGRAAESSEQGDATTAVETALPPPPRPRAPAAAAAEAGPAAPEQPTVSAAETFADRSSRLIESVITLAELAAVEIRAGAELEAAAIRERAAERGRAPATSQLLALLERQRQMLAALSAQTDRLDEAGAVVRAQIRALEAEREHIQELVDAARRAP